MRWLTNSIMALLGATMASSAAAADRAMVESSIRFAPRHANGSAPHPHRPGPAGASAACAGEARRARAVTS